MYGQMTAGSWIYIGTQGILQGTYETFAAVAGKQWRHARRHDHPHRRARRHGRCAAARGHHERRCRDLRRRRREPHRPADRAPLPRPGRRPTSTRRSRWRSAANDARRPLSIGLVGNAAEVLPELLERGVPIDIVTDQTSAHDPLSYLPSGVAFEDMKTMAEAEPVDFTERARASMAKHVEAMVGFMDAGAEVFDYGNSIRDEARKAATSGRSTSPASCPPTSGRCSARAWARSAGRRCRATRRTSPPPTGRSWSCSRRTSSCTAGSRWPARRVAFQGCRRASAGSATASGTWPG